MLEGLIGYQVCSINDNNIELSKDGEKVFLEILEDIGDCCGYNEITKNIFYSKNDEQNPIITNIEINDECYGYEGDCKLITFYGSNKTLFEIKSESSSGSGWKYGSSVTLKCEILNIEKVLTEW